MNIKRLLILTCTVLSGLTLVSMWLMFLSGRPESARAASYTVCLAGPPTCDYSSIQAAIDAAGNDDTLELAGDTFTEGIIVDKSLTISGAGAENTIVQAAGTPGIATSPVISINEGVNVTITGLTVRHGTSGIYNRGNLTVTQSSLSRNSLGLNNGTGNGIVTMTHSTVSRNTSGGGIIGSNFYIANSEIISNSNFAGAQGGGIGAHGSFSLTDSKVISNSAVYGGGIFLHGPSTLGTLNNVYISENSATSDGGGIFFANGGKYNLSNVTVISNSSETQGGGIANGCIDIICGGLSITITNSAILYNSADGGGGGISAYYGSLELKNTSISGNVAGTNGGGIGGGVPKLENVTITENSAGGNGGGVSGNIAITNSIIAGNHDSSETIHPDCSGFIASNGYNLVGVVEGCNWVDATGDMTGTLAAPLDPVIGPLQDNGGPTLTHALLQDSPAIETIPAGVNGCGISNTTDQRGISRPQGGSCDVGAFEYDFPVNIKLVVDDNNPTPGQIITFTIQVTNTVAEAVTGCIVTDTLPTGLDLLGPIILVPSTSGTVGEAPPTIASDLLIPTTEQITITFPVEVSNELQGGTELTNPVWFSSTQMETVAKASISITIDYFYTYLPLITSP